MRARRSGLGTRAALDTARLQPEADLQASLTRRYAQEERGQVKRSEALELDERERRRAARRSSEDAGPEAAALSAAIVSCAPSVIEEVGARAAE